MIFSADRIFDSKRNSIEERILSSETTGTLEKTTLFEHLLASENLTMEEVYTSISELLLSGVDTVWNSPIKYIIVKCMCTEICNLETLKVILFIVWIKQFVFAVHLNELSNLLSVRIHNKQYRKKYTHFKKL